MSRGEASDAVVSANLARQSFANCLDEERLRSLVGGLREREPHLLGFILVQMNQALGRMARVFEGLGEQQVEVLSFELRTMGAAVYGATSQAFRKLIEGLELDNGEDQQEDYRKGAECSRQRPRALQAWGLRSQGNSRTKMPPSFIEIGPSSHHPSRTDPNLSLVFHTPTRLRRKPRTPLSCL